MKPGSQLRNSMLISLALHVAIFSLPSANFQLFLPLRKKSKPIEVSLVNMPALLPPEESRIRREKEEPLPEEEDTSKKGLQVQLPAPCKAAFEEAEVVREQTPPTPEPADIPPERIVDFRGYPREAVTAIFERYGLKYERYTPRLGPTRTTGLVSTFTFEGKQLGASREDSPVSFAGEPRPGSMVLVIPARVYLDLLEAERKELRRRSLPPTISLSKVIFGIGRDEQGGYILAVRELVIKAAAVPARDK